LTLQLKAFIRRVDPLGDDVGLAAEIATWDTEGAQPPGGISEA
jgi:hypothetical protein